MPRSTSSKPPAKKSRRAPGSQPVGQLVLDDATALALQKNPDLVHELQRKVGELQARLELYDRRAELPAVALELFFELIAVRRAAGRWKGLAKMLLDRARYLAAMNDRIRRGGFTDKTLNEVEQDKRRRAEEEERERQARSLTLSGQGSRPALAGGRGRRVNFD